MIREMTVDDVRDYALLVLNSQLSYLCSKKLYRMQCGDDASDLQIEIDLCRKSILLVKGDSDEYSIG
jgi:hypothetical protein